MAVTHFDSDPTRVVEYVTVACAAGGDPKSHVRTAVFAKVTCKRCRKLLLKRGEQNARDTNSPFVLKS